MIAYSTCENSNDFRICSHLGSKEDDSDEHEQRTEHVHEIRNEIQIIIKDDCLQRCFLRHEIVDLLTDVEDDHDADDKEQSHKEGADELLCDIKVYLFRCQIHYPKVWWLFSLLSHPSKP